MLASTEISETWVVFPGGCVSEPSNCIKERGGAYNTTLSKTWDDKGRERLKTESNLGYAGLYDNGDFGYDTLGVDVPPGHANVSLDKQVIAGVEIKDFFLGNLGLANRQHTFGNGEQASGFLWHLNASNLIPSLSYGYTAGASYRKRQRMESDWVPH